MSRGIKSNMDLLGEVAQRMDPDGVKIVVLSDPTMTLLSGFPDIMTVQHAALALSVTDTTIRKMIGSGEIPARQFENGQYRILKTDLIRLMGGDL